MYEYYSGISCAVLVRQLQIIFRGLYLFIHMNNIQEWSFAVLVLQIRTIFKGPYLFIYFLLISLFIYILFV